MNLWKKEACMRLTLLFRVNRSGSLRSFFFVFGPILGLEMGLYIWVGKRGYFFGW